MGEGSGNGLTESFFVPSLKPPAGRFNFRDLLGNYTVSASHPSWSFDHNEVAVVVESPLDAGVLFYVAGYGIKTSIHCDGEPVPGVDLLLYAEGDEVNTSALSCRFLASALHSGTSCPFSSNFPPRTIRSRDGQRSTADGFGFPAPLMWPLMYPPRSTPEQGGTCFSPEPGDCGSLWHTIHAGRGARVSGGTLWSIRSCARLPGHTDSF